MRFRFSDYTVEQLQEEEKSLKEELIRAEQLGYVSEVSILERKLQMIRSYMLLPDAFKPGEVYTLKDENGTPFEVTKVKGVMAWGHRLNSNNERSEDEEAIPISLLEEIK